MFMGRPPMMGGMEGPMGRPPMGGMEGPMGRPPMGGMEGPMGRPPMGGMGGPMGRPPMGLPPLPPSDYDYDSSSSEEAPSLLSTIIQQMMGGKPGIEITPVSASSESSSGEDNYVAESVEVSAPSVEIEPTTPHRGDDKEYRIPEEVSYRRAP